jgi:hypothetical protein
MTDFIRIADAGNKDALVYSGEIHRGPPETLETAWGPVVVTEDSYVFTRAAKNENDIDEKFVVHPQDMEQFWQKLAP